MSSVTLFYTADTSDKFYRVEINDNDETFDVTAFWGRRGELGQSQVKGSYTTFEEAHQAAIKLLHSKAGKGYTTDVSGKPYAPSEDFATLLSGTKVDVVGVVGVLLEKFGTKGKGLGWGTTPNTPIKDQAPSLEYMPQLLNSVDENVCSQCLNDPAWGMQEKMDGKHIVLVVENGSMTAYQKQGKVCGFPSSWTNRWAGEGRYVFDGEMIGDVFHVFDLLYRNGQNLRGLSYKLRFRELYSYVEMPGWMVLVPLWTGNNKALMYAELKAKNAEGVVFKRLDAEYHPGRPSSGGDFLKYKFVATCSCRVAGINQKNSIALELLNDNGKWVGVGNCTTIGKGSFQVGNVVEVRYLYAFPGGSLFQPNLLSIRDDVDALECTMSQLKYKAGTPQPVVKRGRIIEW